MENFTRVVNSVAKAGTSVTKVKEEMVENNIGKNSDPDLTATEHRLLQIFNASPEVANSIANWSKRRNIYPSSLKNKHISIKILWILLHVILTLSSHSVHALSVTIVTSYPFSTIWCFKPHVTSHIFSESTWRPLSTHPSMTRPNHQIHQNHFSHFPQFFLTLHITALNADFVQFTEV